MPFVQSGIEARGYREGASLVVAWVAPTHPAGTVFQVYRDGSLAWSGTARRAVIPYPGGGDTVAIDVGAVGPGESGTVFAASLPVSPRGRVRLAWTGDDADGLVRSYRIHRGATPGAAVDYARPVATVPAYGASRVAAGDSPPAYSWTSPRLATGAWSLGIVPVDSAGNAGTAREVTVDVVSPPRPPAADGDGGRLDYSYDPDSAAVTLSWAASPA